MRIPGSWIENNCIHDSKCSGISIGKEGSTGGNDFTKYRRKPGYQYQMEAVFKARNIGWSRERIGSHVIRNNVIYDCGQNGIVGHLGCVFSEICGNEIYNIAVKHEFFGHEIAGIKLHAATDVQIHHNYIHDCTLGTWLDWQAQGTRVSGNIYDGNNRDLMVEVTHGPYLVDNNIFTSPYAFDNAAQGGAYIHNLCCGFTNHYPVPDRATPYHLPHSTEVLGTVPVYGFDDRWYQNIFVWGEEEGRFYGTSLYNGAPVSMEEYVERFLSLGKNHVVFDVTIENLCICGKRAETLEEAGIKVGAYAENIKNALQVPIGFDTDVNAAVLGEVTWGAAKGTESAIYITVGTGVGVGVYVNGNLLHGLVHPEAGHILLGRHPGDLYESGCPYHNSCMEGLASGPAIEKRWGRKAAELADKEEVWELEAYYIAQAVANYIMVYSPQKIILWGGVMHQEQLFPMVRKQVKAFLNGYIPHKTILEDMDQYIVPPALGEDPGVLGAIRLGMLAM